MIDTLDKNIILLFNRSKMNSIKLDKIFYILKFGRSKIEQHEIGLASDFVYKYVH